MRKHVIIWAGLTLAVAAAGAAWSAEAPADLNTVLSRLQAMSHGSFPAAQWTEVLQMLDRLTEEARRKGEVDKAIEARALKASVLSGMRQDHAGALAVLEQTKREFAGTASPAFRLVYLRQAEVYGRLGDEEAVRRVMAEFRASPYFDPEVYPFRGGQGPNDPLQLTRPNAGGNDSISITAMEVARQQARFAPGHPFPDFQLTTRAGRHISLADYRGRVLLVDIWQRNWVPWQRDIGNLSGIHSRYQSRGFDVVGISLDVETADFDAYLQRQGMTWPQVVDDRTLPRQLGLFGECANFLIDRNGIIIGRDLHGSELVEAVRRACGK